MPNVTIKLGLDNRVKPGEQTLNEIVATLESQGVSTTAAKPIKDPITGKLIRVEVNLPDTASAQATAAINANSGVAVATVPLVAPLFIRDLTAMALAGPLTLQSGQIIQVQAQEDGFGGPEGPTFLGHLTSGNTYTDLDDANREPYTLVALASLVGLGGGTFTVAPSELSITFDGGGPLTLANANPIVIPTEPSNDHYYIDIDGKMYLGQRVVQGQILVQPRTYEEAFASGAV